MSSDKRRQSFAENLLLVLVLCDQSICLDSGNKVTDWFGECNGMNQHPDDFHLIAGPHLFELPMLDN